MSDATQPSATPPPPAPPVPSVTEERALAAKDHSKFKAAQTAKKLTTTLLAGAATTAAFLTSSFSADGAFHPGVDRWSLKTSVQNLAVGDLKLIKMSDFVKLPPPEIPGGKKSPFADKFLPSSVGDLKEGDLVVTRGYIHLVGFDKGDSDYHVQMNDKPGKDADRTKTCVIVEIPHPLSTNDARLRQAFADARRFIRETCFGGKAPKGKVNDPPFVEVQGQLFYDLHHHPKKPLENPGGGRGKQLEEGVPMRATTVWEIHPVISIALADPAENPDNQN